MNHSKLLRKLTAFALLSVACGSEPAPMELANNSGAADGAGAFLTFSDTAPDQGLVVNCDSEAGCSGNVLFEMVTPEPCDLFADERCGTREMPAASVDLGTLMARNILTGEVNLYPYVASTDGGEYVRIRLAVPFTLEAKGSYLFYFQKTIPEKTLTLLIRAEWSNEASPEAAQLEEYLASVPGLTFERSGTEQAGYLAYDLTLVQHLDPNDPNSATFEQRGMLYHRDQNADMVLFTSGYDLDVDYLSELGESRRLNQISIEQRFFGDSNPAQWTAEDWRHVNVRAVAADHHHWVEVLKPFYSGEWVSTGHSKGGMTSLVHRRYYPGDVDATVAYVAPIMFSLDDPRFVPFLEQIGEETCRNNLHALQNAIIRHRAELVAAFEAELMGSVPNVRESIDDTVIDLPWAFWQYRGQAECGAVPTGEDLDNLDMLRGWVSVSATPSRRDLKFSAWNYHAHSEYGTPGKYLAQLSEPLMSLPWTMPPGVETPTFNPTPMRELQDWVLSDAERVIFLYGEYDPWTGGAYEIPANHPTVFRVDVPQAAHNAMLRDLPEEQRGRVEAALNAWLEAPASSSTDWTPRGARYPAMAADL